MAITFAGGTDALAYTDIGWNQTVGTIAFRMKTTQTTANAVPVSIWSNVSRNGFGFIINNTAGKLLVQGYSIAGTPSPMVNFSATTTINDGAWHHIAYCWDSANGGANSIYVDGVQENTQNSSAVWAVGSFSVPLCLGRTNDSFWPSFVGSLSELAVWPGVKLSAREIAALGKPANNFSPPLVRRANLLHYSPLDRKLTSLLDQFVSGPTGTTITEHPRVIGL